MQGGSKQAAVGRLQQAGLGAVHKHRGSVSIRAQVLQGQEEEGEEGRGCACESSESVGCEEVTRLTGCACAHGLFLLLLRRASGSGAGMPSMEMTSPGLQPSGTSSS